jgi:hypothetical protein
VRVGRKESNCRVSSMTPRDIPQGENFKNLTLMNSQTAARQKEMKVG